MYRIVFLAAVAAACAYLLAVPAARAANGTPPGVLAQEDRCGPQPMKPMDCLTGTWICRCHGSGQVCDWELVGCFTRPGLPQPEEVIRPKIEPTWPFPREGGSR